MGESNRRMILAVKSKRSFLMLYSTPLWDGEFSRNGVEPSRSTKQGSEMTFKIGAKTLYVYVRTFPYTTDLDYVALETKSIVA
jgi:hypothetical protein